MRRYVPENVKDALRLMLVLNDLDVDNVMVDEHGKIKRMTVEDIKEINADYLAVICDCLGFDGLYKEVDSGGED